MAIPLPLPQPRTVEALPVGNPRWRRRGDPGPARIVREARGNGPVPRPRSGPAPSPMPVLSPGPAIPAALQAAPGRRRGTDAGDEFARRRAAPRASALEEQLSEPCDPGASPLQQAYGREQALVFARSLRLLYTATLSAFERLRPRDRRALELVELEGQPYAEAGPRLGVPPENMKMIVFRARRRLLLEIGAALRCDRP